MASQQISALCLTVLLTAIPKARSFVVQKDKDALVKLWDETGGESWVSSKEACAVDPCTNDELTAGKLVGGKNSPWPTGDSSKDPCKFSEGWHGVGCYDPCDFYRDGAACAKGRVVSLNLPFNNLVGTIPTEIGVLSNITLLSLSNNLLSGSIPVEIDNIKNVEVIDLHSNQLTGQIPESICSNQNVLHYLHVSKMTATYSCSELHLAHNKFTGTIPALWGNIASLKFLDVSYNQLTGNVPSELFELEELQTFHFQHNTLSGTLPVNVGTKGFSSKLKFLRGHNNQLTGAIPDNTGDLTLLYELNLENNKLNGQIGEWALMNNLRILKLADNELTGAVPDIFATMPNLRHIDMYNNQLTGDMPPSITKLTGLKYLYLQNEQLTPLRQKYCKQRLPHYSMGKYNYVWIKDEYEHMINTQCPDMHSSGFAFGQLPDDY